MASFNTPNIQLGEQGYFYEVNGCKYTGTFPYEWATNHLPNPVCEEYGSGPKDCANCSDKGTINDVFVGYCFNCLNDIYNGEHAEKRNGVYYAEEATDEELWEACPYMRGIYRAQIGDKKYEYEDLELSDEDEEQQEKVHRKPEYVSNEVANINFMAFMASIRPENCDEDNEDNEDNEDDDNNEDENYLAKQQEEDDLRRQQEQEDEDYYYEQYRENDDYADYYDCDYDEPYSCEYPITRRELASIPADMRAVFDPEYQSALANFRAAARGI